MAVRNTNLGGTDWSDGNTLLAADLNDTVDQVLSFGENTNPTQAPVGSVVAWLKSLTGVPATLPSGWIECNGGTIADANSPMNGQTIPDLNGAVDTGLKGYFLRGHSASGVTETSQNLAHTHTLPAGGVGGGSTGPDLSDGPQSWTSLSSGGAEARPHNYSVVWIMRIY